MLPLQGLGPRSSPRFNVVIRELRVQNYKGFRDAQRVELRPLTLFYGENSAGKSALVRLLPWIAESMADPRPGPMMDGEVAREALWQDIVYSGSPTQRVQIEVAWAEPLAAVVTWGLRSGAMPGSCELASVALRGPSGEVRIEDDGDQSWEGKVEHVEGLLPRGGALNLREATGLDLGDLTLAAQWLCGVRVAIPRVEKSLASAPQRLPPDGAGVARFLYYWQRVGRSPEARAALALVLGFYERLGLRLEATDIAPGFFRLEVAAKGQVSPVSLVDTGEGLTQVLAPLIALARAMTGLGPRIVALEQPELHLHTNAQRELAHSIFDAVRGGAQVLIETHSEVLLAAMQLAIAEGLLQPDQVGAYWVARRDDGASVAHSVTFNTRGEVRGLWPISAFDDLLKLKSELFEAQERP